MTSIKAYKEFLLKVNKNDTNTNIKIPISEFVILFNEQKRQWLDDRVKSKESNSYIEDLEELLEADVKLTLKSSNTLKDDYTLPDNFFRRVSSYSIASKGGCSNVVLYNNFIKPKDINVILQNDNQKPSFEYQETVAMLNKNTISVYKTDFTINEVYLTYYREPLDLDLEGYININGTASKNVDVDLDDFSMQEIISRTATEAVRNYESVEQTQLAVQRQQQNEGTIN